MIRTRKFYLNVNSSVNINCRDMILMTDFVKNIMFYQTVKSVIGHPIKKKYIFASIT